MNGTATAYVILALVALQRFGELALARRNTKALLARGAVEIGAGHYPLIVFLHTFWLLSVLWFLPHPTPVRWELLAVFLVLQALRLWVLATLGPYWTTRIISLPGAPLATGGPYRFVRHPNYLVVAGEILVLPLVFGETMVAIIFSLANAALLFWRIRQEETGLTARRRS
ncbi:MAG TPA: isoprenylcysteine carboxylmethyltransferase family protein [Rhizomicrobium sp.]|nr:isoprenylcysteine carboxylmethyltransferase family protein [Rhizomicrobium sp.]